MPTSAKDDIWGTTILNKILITIIKKTWSNLFSKFTFRPQVYYWHLQHQFSSEYVDFLNLAQTDWSYFSVCCRNTKELTLQARDGHRRYWLTCVQVQDPKRTLINILTIEHVNLAFFYSAIGCYKLPEMWDLRGWLQAVFASLASSWCLGASVFRSCVRAPHCFRHIKKNKEKW